MMKSTIQEIFSENIKSDNETGITFIEGRNSTEHLSYKKLYLEACYKLYSLQEKGLKPGDELVFQFESNKKFVITFWACIFGKIIPVPVAYAAASNTLNKICEVWKTLKNPYVITDNLALKDYFQKFKNEDDVFDEMLEKLINYNDLQISKRGIPLQSELSDLVFIQFSSGSTGFPKGVTNSQEAVLYNIGNYLKYLGINSSDKVLGWVPLTHDMGLVFFHILPLLSNSPQFLMPPSLFLTFPELWLESLSQYEISISGSPNFGYKLILENLDRVKSKNLSLCNLRIMLNSAEPVSIDVCREFTNEFASQGLSKDCLSPGYGLAEAVLGVSLCHDRKFEEYLLDRGKLNVGDKIKILNQESDNTASFANVGTFDGTEIKITDEKGKLLSDGHLGFIQLKSKAVTKSFYNNPEITQNTISKDGWLNTGDIGFIHNKNLIITGRAKEMIIINGKNYFPNDIDYVLSKLPQIKFQQAVSCSVFNNSTYTDEIFVFVLYKDNVEGFKSLSAEIKKHINFQLGIEVSKVIPVDQIPKTTSGKIQRYILRDRYHQGIYDSFLKELEKIEDIHDTNSYVAPITEMECKLAKVWKESLGIEHVGINDNFFYLGGNSLKIGALASRIQDVFGISINVGKLFTAIDFKDQLRLIEEFSVKPIKEIEIIPKKTQYPISSIQKRLFIHYQLNPSSVAYNTPVVLDVKGNFDIKRCQDTFKKIIARHEILRTSFHIINKEVVQKIHDEVDFQLEYVINNEKDFNKILKSYITPFNLEDPSLIRAFYFEEQDKLIIDIHHIVADGASFDIFFKEFHSLYSGEKLQPLTLQYKDFSHWHQNSSPLESLQGQKEFWVNQFIDIPEPLILPYDFSREDRTASLSDTVGVIIDGEKRDKLKELCKKEKVTMFTLLLSTVYSLLYRLTSQEDIVIGTSTIGRWEKHLQGLIGMFTNLLPLRNFPLGDISFSDFLKEVSANTSRCLANQEYTYEKLIDDLKIPPNKSNTALFNLMFEYYAFNWAKEKEQPKNSPFAGYDYPTVGAKFDLSIKAIEEKDRQVIFFDYNTDLFRRDSVERFASYFTRIVDEILENKEQLLGDIEILSNKERTKILTEFNTVRVL